MALKSASTKLKAFFLIQFTKQLVNNSKTDYILAIERLKKDQIKNKLNEKRLFIKKPQRQIPLTGPAQIPLTPKQIPKAPRFPQTIQEIRPIPTTSKIDLGKLNPLIQDPTVSEIICQGHGKNIIVNRMRDSLPTKIILTRQEIEQIITNFSQASKIPLSDDTLRVAVGPLIISAIMSDVVEPRFTIQKIAYVLI